MGKFFKKLDIKQLRWGLVAGVITFGLMGIAYYVGTQKAENDEILGELKIIEGTPKNVNILISETCESTVLEGEEMERRYCIEYKKGEKTLGLLKRLAGNTDEFSFDYEESDFGAFITSINNYHPDVKSKFWAFYVNGQMSMVGVSEYKTTLGDELGFKVEEVTF